MTIDEKIYTARKAALAALAARYSVAEINRRLGREPNNSYLYGVLSGVKDSRGRPRSLSSKMARDIEKAFGLPPESMDQPPAPPPAAEEPAKSTPTGGFILLDYEGPDGTARKLGFSRSSLARRLGERPDYSSLLVYSVDSSDLHPAVQRGDLVFIDRAATGIRPGIYLLELSGRRMLRRISVDLAGTLFLSADALPAAPIPLSKVAFTVVGRAVYLIRGLEL